MKVSLFWKNWIFVQNTCELVIYVENKKLKWPEMTFVFHIKVETDFINDITNN